MTTTITPPADAAELKAATARLDPIRGRDADDARAQIQRARALKATIKRAVQAAVADGMDPRMAGELFKALAAERLTETGGGGAAGYIAAGRALQGWGLEIELAGLAMQREGV